MQVRAELFDWSMPVHQQRYDVVLACDVLYEDFSVEPVASVVPKLLYSSNSRLILADPANRTVQNRERFVKLLQSCEHEHYMLSVLDKQTVVMDNLPAEVQLLQFVPQQARSTVASPVAPL